MSDKTSNKTKLQNTDQKSKSLGFEPLVENSVKFKQLKNECVVAAKLSLTGITNLVVNYEDPCLVNCFLKSCFKTNELYRGSYEIDAVELQRGSPGAGYAAQYLDQLIFGTFDEEDDASGMDVKVPKRDPNTGKRFRNPDGFVNRKSRIRNS